MIKVSRLADYAVVVLADLINTDSVMTAAALAQTSRLPEPTVAKVLKLLAGSGIVTSTRGANGGYGLSRSAVEISVADIVMAVEGPVSLVSCIDGTEGNCDYQAHCCVKGRWDDVNVAVREALESISLADMVAAPSFVNLSKDMENYGRL